MNLSNPSKTSYEVTLSQESWAGLETIANQFNVSVSELFERIGSGLLAIVDPDDVEDLEDYLNLQAVIEPESQNQVRTPSEPVKQRLRL